MIQVDFSMAPLIYCVAHGYWHKQYHHDHQGQVRCQQCTCHWGDSGKTDQVYFGVWLVG